MSNLTYDTFKTSVKNVEKRYFENCKEANIHYKRLLDNNFEKMKESISGIVKDLSKQELARLLGEMSVDKDVDFKLYTMILVTWIDCHDESDDGMIRALIAIDSFLN